MRARSTALAHREESEDRSGADALVDVDREPTAVRHQFLALLDSDGLRLVPSPHGVENRGAGGHHHARGIHEDTHRLLTVGCHRGATITKRLSAGAVTGCGSWAR